MRQRSEAIDRNPFSPEAIAQQSTKRFSTAAARAALAPELACLRRDGYVILERVLRPEKVARIRAEFDRLHAATTATTRCPGPTRQFLGVPPPEAMRLARPLQKLIGYWVVNNLLGYVENGSPRAFAERTYPPPG